MPFAIARFFDDHPAIISELGARPHAVMESAGQGLRRVGRDLKPSDSECLGHVLRRRS